MQDKLRMENDKKEMEQKFMEDNSSSIGFIEVNFYYLFIIKIIILQSTYTYLIIFYRISIIY